MKNLLIAALLSVLGMTSAAKAECSQDEAYNHEAYDIAFELAEHRCDYAAQGWIESGLTEDDVGGWDGMYEACMRLSVPPMLLAPAQHYDTSDGAFWRAGGGL